MNSGNEVKNEYRLAGSGGDSSMGYELNDTHRTAKTALFDMAFKSAK